jgi:hypothetical protein
MDTGLYEVLGDGNIQIGKIEVYQAPSISPRNLTIDLAQARSDRKSIHDLQLVQYRTEIMSM